MGLSIFCWVEKYGGYGAGIDEVLGLEPEAKLNTTSSSGTGSHLIGIYYPLVNYPVRDDEKY